MLAHRIAFASVFAVAAATASAGCGDVEEDGFSLTLDVALAPNEGALDFITPVGTVESLATEEVVGKPYFIAAFPAGLAPGGDNPFEAEWGAFPADLSVSFTTPAVYDDGPYDMVFVVYVNTEITPDMMQPGAVPPGVVPGDLATYTVNQDAVRPGDPAIIPGVVRLNIAGADQRMAVENRVPADPRNAAQLAAALTNTVMLVP